MGDWVTPRICRCGSICSASRTVGTRSIAWVYWWRIWPLALMPFWPMNEEGIRNAAAIGLALPSPERRVARERPAPRVVIEVFGTTKIVKGGEICFQVVRHIVEELVFVGRTIRPAFGTRAV